MAAGVKYRKAIAQALRDEMERQPESFIVGIDIEPGGTFMTNEGLLERLGPERIIWGTDVPILMRYTTYRQSLDQIRLYCQDLLGEEDMACVLGRNMARLMGLEPA